MRKSFLLAAMLAGSAVAANAGANELSYTYVEAGYTQLNINDDLLADPEAAGGYLRGSYAIAPQVYVFGGYGSVSDDYGFQTVKLETTVDQAEVGIGYHMAFGERVDFTADIAYVRNEIEVELTAPGFPRESGREDAKGGRASLGLRGTPSARTEAWIKAGYLDGGDFVGDWVGNLGGQIKFTQTWGLVGEVEAIDDLTRYFVGVRASF